MKYIVTGAAGFIGINYLHSIIDKKNKILCIDYINNASNKKEILNLTKRKKIIFKKIDISNFNKLSKVIFEFKPNYVINFAAESHVDNSIKNPSKFVKSNIIGTFNLVESCRQLINSEKIFKKFMHISTDEVYGSLSKSEKKSSEGSVYKPNSPYSASKASSDHIVRSYVKTYNFPAIVTHCTNNYGPWQNKEKLIPKVILNYLNNKKIPLYGNGKNIRDWIYVDDHIRAINQLIKKGIIGEVYNISGKNQISNVAIIKTILEILDAHTKNKDSFNKLVAFVEDRKGHDFRYDINASKIEKEINFFPKVTIEKGILKTINWYLKQYRKK